MNTGLPYAEGAEIAQSTQRNSLKLSSVFLCVLCETFATSAYGCPVLCFL
jgi:hypothetical protein